MGASAWTVFNKAKKHIGSTGINLASGGSTFKGVLFQNGLSVALSAGVDVSTLGSLGAFTCTAGGGDEVVALGTIVWSNAASANDPTIKWDTSDAVFTASTQAISSVRYMVIYASQGASAGTGRVLCYAALSTIAFPVTASNTLTVQMAASGIFTLA